MTPPIQPVLPVAPVAPSTRRWGAVAAALASIAGLLAHPEVLNLLPQKWAVGLTVAGIVAQAATGSVLTPPPAP